MVYQRYLFSMQFCNAVFLFYFWIFCCIYYHKEMNCKNKLMWQYNVCAKSFDYDGFTSYIKLENSLSVENKSSRELQFLVPFSVPTVVQHNGLKLFLREHSNFVLFVSKDSPKWELSYYLMVSNITCKKYSTVFRTKYVNIHKTVYFPFHFFPTINDNFIYNI